MESTYDWNIAKAWWKKLLENKIQQKNHTHYTSSCKANTIDDN